MKAKSWDSIEVERMSDKITRQVIHGQHATVARFSLSQGAVVPKHAHESEQFTAVAAGALKLSFPDGDVVLHAGEVLHIPSNVPHAAEALEDCIVQDTFAPRREDWIRKDDAYLRK